MTRAFIGLGGNMGDRQAYLAAGRRGIAAIEGVRVVTESPIFETEPVGPSTDAFLNQVVEIDSQRDPEALMQALLEIERANGRERREKWGPRTLDLDLLAMVTDDGALVAHTSETLALPHPGLTSREFVLAPLERLAPELVIAGKTVRQWLAGLPPARRNVLRIL